MVARLESNRAIASRYGLSRAALQRHQEHVHSDLQAAAEVVALDHRVSLLGRVEKVVLDAEELLGQAQKKGIGDKATSRDLVAWASAIREVRKTLELLGHATGELQRGPGVAVQVNVQTPKTGEGASLEREHSSAELRHMARIALQEADELDRLAGLLPIEVAS